MADELAVYPVLALIEELKRRDLTFLIAYADHQQFTKHDTDIVWGLDRGGNVVLQLTLLRLLTTHLDQVEQERLASPTDETA